MVPKTQQLLHAYMVKIETPTGRSTTLPATLLTLHGPSALTAPVLRKEEIHVISDAVAKIMADAAYAV